MLALDEVRYLLDPARFRDLDVAFVKATNDMLAVLPDCPQQYEEQEQLKTSPNSQKQHEVKEQLDTSTNHQKPHEVKDSGTELIPYQSQEITKNQTTTPYQELQKFQQACKQLNHYCHQLHDIVQECNEHNFLPDTLIKEIGDISHKLQSQSFRIAVVGEFSQGKSTLLNALLGEEIQPVRAIPCSGTITVLKYGTKKRVICRYKDGREEEIPFEQYQEKAAISEEAALDGVSDELASSEIKEIVFEHPDLELCRHGVEIVDSPGLNEHPERTSITQQLIKDTDAVIFLTNASRPLTQGERELIQDLRLQLNGGRANIPAENLFILTNFMDLLRREKDRESVQQRIERFVQGDNPIIVGENRIHFISAQAALDAIIDGYEDDYLNKFNSFTQSIENFLTNEIGKIKINNNVSNLTNIVEQFNQEQIQQKQNLLEQISAISAWDVELLQLTDSLEEATINELINSWNTWVETLVEKIYSKSEQWSCSQDNEEKILQNYTKKFNKALSQELNNWLEEEIKGKILKDNLSILDEEIDLTRETIEDFFDQFDTHVASNFKEQLQLSLNKQNISMNIDKNNIDSEDGDGDGVGFGLGGAGLVAFGLLAFTGIGLIPIALTALGSGFGIGALFGESKEAKIKRVVLDKGFEHFNNSVEEILDKISEEITSIFESKLEQSRQMMKEAILIIENVIEQQTVSLNDNSKQIEQIQNDMDKVLAQVMK